MEKGEVAGVDVALQPLHPVALLEVLADGDVLLWEHVELEIGQWGRFGPRTHVEPDEAAALAAGICQLANAVLDLTFGEKDRGDLAHVGRDYR